MEEHPASVEEKVPAPPADGWRAWLALNSSTGALLAAILLVGMGTELWSPLMPEYLAGLAAPILLIALYGSAKDLLEAGNYYAGGTLAARFNTRRALLLFNALDMKFRELKLRPDPQCPLCGSNPTITELIDYEMFCGITPEPAVAADNPDEVTVQDGQHELIRNGQGRRGRLGDRGLKDGRGAFLRQVGQLGRGHLHPESQLIGCDAGLQI